MKKKEVNKKKSLALEKVDQKEKRKYVSEKRKRGQAFSPKIKRQQGGASGRGKGVC